MISYFPLLQEYDFSSRLNRFQILCWNRIFLIKRSYLKILNTYTLRIDLFWYFITCEGAMYSQLAHKIQHSVFITYISYCMISILNQNLSYLDHIIFWEVQDTFLLTIPQMMNFKTKSKFEKNMKVKQSCVQYLKNFQELNISWFSAHAWWAKAQEFPTHAW